MSVGNSDSNSTAEDSSQDSPKKAYTKMDPIRKLRIIYALDNGQSKTDIAREYGVHIQTITYIYKQKESIVKKYSHKYKELGCVNLDQSLTIWLTTQTRSGNVVTGAKLREKALEIMTDLNEEFPCIDDWLADFKIRHNVLMYTPDIKCSSKAKEAWVRLHNSTDSKDLYIGSTCALLHSLSFDNFVNGQGSEDYMSLLVLVNSTGCDKKMLGVVGMESLQIEHNIKSLPVNYYHCSLPLVDTNIISNYLDKWNTDLKSKGRNIVLVMNLSDNIAKNLCFSNIKVINSSNMDFVTKTVEKVTECLKCHYRKLQITRKTIYAESCQFSLLDYIDMISAAWHNVPNYFIKRLFILPEDSLYFKANDDAENQSLSHWCRTFNISIDLELYSNAVDEFIYCDKKLQSLNLEETDKEAPNEFKPQKCVQSTSGIEAYQAMQRLVSYMQGERTRASSIQSAKLLENHLEYGALSEIKDIFSCINDNDIE